MPLYDWKLSKLKPMKNCTSIKVALRSGSPCNLHIQELVPMKYSVEWCCSNLIQNGPQCQHHEELLGYCTRKKTHININIYVTDKSWNLELPDKSFLKVSWTGLKTLQMGLSQLLDQASWKIHHLSKVWKCGTCLTCLLNGREWISLSFPVKDELKCLECSLEVTIAFTALNFWQT